MYIVRGLLGAVFIQGWGGWWLSASSACGACGSISSCGWGGSTKFTMCAERGQLLGLACLEGFAYCLSGGVILVVEEFTLT